MPALATHPLTDEDTEAVSRFRKAVCAAQRANADCIHIAGLLKRADLYSDDHIRVLGRIVDTDALMAANKELDRINGLLHHVLMGQAVLRQII